MLVMVSSFSIDLRQPIWDQCPKDGVIETSVRKMVADLYSKSINSILSWGWWISKEDMAQLGWWQGRGKELPLESLTSHHRSFSRRLGCTRQSHLWLQGSHSNDLRSGEKWNHRSLCPIIHHPINVHRENQCSKKQKESVILWRWCNWRSHKTLSQKIQTYSFAK